MSPPFGMLLSLLHWFKIDPNFSPPILPICEQKKGKKSLVILPLVISPILQTFNAKLKVVQLQKALLETIISQILPKV
jgi:hypothetical protein